MFTPLARLHSVHCCLLFAQKPAKLLDGLHVFTKLEPDPEPEPEPEPLGGGALVVVGGGGLGGGGLCGGAAPEPEPDPEPEFLQQTRPAPPVQTPSL